MTHDSSSYIVSSVPFLSKAASLSSSSLRGISALFLSYLNVGLSFCVLSAVSSSFFQNVPSFRARLPYCPALLLLHSRAGPSSSCFRSPSSCLCSRELQKPCFIRGKKKKKKEKYRTVSGHSSGRGRLPEHLKLLKTSPTVMSNFRFCLNTHRVRQKRKKNTVKPDDERIICQSLYAYRKSPPKPRRQSSPMHYKSVATLLPYGFYAERHDETKIGD